MRLLFVNDKNLLTLLFFLNKLIINVFYCAFEKIFHVTNNVINKANKNFNFSYFVSTKDESLPDAISL